MANVLNLTIKKDIFGTILDGTCSEICVDKTNWWQKRLMDKDGNFKDFDVAVISSNNTEKLEYPISSIEETPECYCISIVNGVVNNKEEQNLSMCVVVEDNEAEQPIIDSHADEIEEETSIKSTLFVESVGFKEYEPANEPVVDTQIEDVNENQEQKEEGETETDEQQVEQYDYRNDIMSLLDIFCGMKDVFNVSYRDVRIRPNGKILGCYDKTLAIKSDVETRFNFERKEYVHPKYISDEDFVDSIGAVFKEMLAQNYVFINKSKCGFIKAISGENIFVITAITKKKYSLR